MILDTEVNGCVIWHNGRVTRLYGTPIEVCEELYKRITDIPYYKKGRPIVKQLFDIGIDTKGAGGSAYKHILNSIGLCTYDIPSKKIDDMLSVKNKNMLDINTTYYSDENWSEFNGRLVHR